MIKKIIAVMLCIICLSGVFEFPVSAVSYPEIRTTLVDNSEQLGSKKTFDVWARNSANEKIKAVVKLNGDIVKPVWDDSEKSSYTLLFTKEGENIVTVSASSDGGKKKELTYHINYRKAKPGEEIGKAVWSVELFTIGCGFLVYPVEVPIYEGETAAEQLIRLLNDNGYVGYYNGTPKSAFYLGYIADGNSSAETYDNYSKSTSPKTPKNLDISPNIPKLLTPYLEETSTYFDADDYSKNSKGYLGEFVFTNGSGWMYSVNGSFPNVGFADEYLSDGDVVRVQYTLAYGADIGGLGALGGVHAETENQPESGFYTVANKDELCIALCRARSAGKNVQQALSVMSTLNASQTDVDNAVKLLNNASSNPSASSSVASSSSASTSTVASSSSTSSKSSSVSSSSVTSSSSTVASSSAVASSSTVASSNASSSNPASSSNSTAETVETEIVTAADKALSIAEEIIDWKKKDVNSETELMNSAFLELAGSTAGDWYPIGLGRLGIEDNYSGYLAVIEDKIEERYKLPSKLSSAKATEWHRIALAVLAAGGDPTKIGNSEINLIADGTYDRGKTTSLGRQGINGWIWGLIALDSKRYEVPENAFNSRSDIIMEIMCRQLSDGGFALSGNKADPDITAMAVQALSPYYNSEEHYSYTQKALKTEVSKTVREVIDEALECLSEMQLEGGDFESWGTQNVESTDQVLTALCCLGIDALNDDRFIKNGNTLLDGILRYQMNDGGFTHSFTYDPENPTSTPNVSNSMAGEQTLYTMAALWRQENGMRTLYDFRAEQSGELKQRITALKSEISKLSENTSFETLQSLANEYYSIPESERSYVNGFWELYDLAVEKGVDMKKTAENMTAVESETTNTDNEKTEFTESDKQAVSALPEKLSTEQYVTVTALLYKLENSNDFEGKDEYLKKLNSAKAEISSVQAEIDSLNSDILSRLYPFESITVFDKTTVDEIYMRYETLSDYDKSKIERREDIVKTKTKIDNELRGIIIAVVLFISASVIAIFLVVRIRKRRRRKALEMEELAENCSDE